MVSVIGFRLIYGVSVNVAGGVNVGAWVKVGTIVIVGVLLGISVSVGVALGVIEGVNEGITKEVKVGTGVDVGRLVGWFMSCDDSGVTVQVTGSERGVVVMVGMLMKIVGNAVGCGNGFNELLSSNHKNPKSPHKHTVDRIVNADKISQIDNFTSVDPFCKVNQAS